MSALKSWGRYSFGPSVLLDALALARARSLFLSLAFALGMLVLLFLHHCRFCCCEFSVMPRLHCFVGGRGHSC
jgi:hypothetical protein